MFNTFSKLESNTDFCLVDVDMFAGLL